MDRKPIHVTKAFLPPLEEYVSLLEGIWERGQLTNNGPLVKQLEEQLREHLGVRHLVLVANGTLALQIAIKAMGLKDEVITTPFSYVATTSSLVWESCTPVFADVEPDTLTLDPVEVEKAITPKTTAILATHVYGNPCDCEALAKIADRHGLQLLYDAAHAFGVEYLEQPIMTFGHASIISFHATKLFHSCEGGAIATDDDELADRFRYMRNFGHKGQEEFWGVGINGKMSELHAAMGLANLGHLDEVRTSRGSIAAIYRHELGLENEFCWREHAKLRDAYYPFLYPSERELLQARERLNSAGIFPRRYFFPCLSELPYLSATLSCPSSRRASKRVLCLPLSHDITRQEGERIACLARPLAPSESPTG